MTKEPPGCAYYDVRTDEVRRYQEHGGTLPTGHRCNEPAASYDEMMRGWACLAHVEANRCLRRLLPPELAELAVLLGNADLDDDAMDAILADQLDQRASMLEAFLDPLVGVARDPRPRAP